MLGRRDSSMAHECDLIPHVPFDEVEMQFSYGLADEHASFRALALTIRVEIQHIHRRGADQFQDFLGEMMAGHSEREQCAGILFFQFFKKPFKFWCGKFPGKDDFDQIHLFPGGRIDVPGSIERESKRDRFKVRFKPAKIIFDVDVRKGPDSMGRFRYGESDIFETQSQRIRVEEDRDLDFKEIGRIELFKVRYQRELSTQVDCSGNILSSVDTVSCRPDDLRHVRPYGIEARALERSAVAGAENRDLPFFGLIPDGQDLMRSPVCVPQRFIFLVPHHFECLLRTVLDACKTILAQMIHRLRHFPLVPVIPLMDIVDAVRHAPPAVETVVLPDDLELPDLCGG
ncbi:hypothetical protein ES703_124747 [subsurface metagenome]